ncbi:MAG: branched-chain amino acid ABC transporter substrate-binding protein, partial [Comamonadaceae bacterium]
IIRPNTVCGSVAAGALKRTRAEGNALNVNAFARAMETATIRTPLGEITMRAADHQALLPIVVSTVAKDAKYKADDTDMGFKPVKVFSAAEAAVPAQASCKMQRPS